METLAPWPAWKKALFLFAAFFFTQISLGGLFAEFTGIEYMEYLTPAVGKYVLGIREPLNRIATGSGDALPHWVDVLSQLLASGCFATLYLLIDRRPRNFSRAFEYLWVLLRYFLAAMLFVYGFAKVFHLQMPEPTPLRLMEPYGESSPMGLLWTFIGHSAAYSAFTGWAEIIPGLLLLFRRTVLLGAIMSTLVMLQVFVLNLCYDVPVKIFSCELMLMSVVIALPDVNRLWRFFISHEQVDADPIKPFFRRPKWQKIANVVKSVIVVTMFGGLLFLNYNGFGHSTGKPLFYGIWDVREVKRNGVLAPPLLSDDAYWRKWMVAREGMASIRMANDSFRRFDYVLDTTLRTLKIHPASDTMTRYLFEYELPDSTHLILRGRMGADSVEMRLVHFDDQTFRLKSRGFHWVNERPFNR